MEILNRKCLDVWPQNAIYVGRGHPLGNPYRIGEDGTREEVIAKYRNWIESCLKTGDERIIEAFRYLREDFHLVCSCAPKPCHAKVIREIWERDFKDKPLVFVFGSNRAGRHGKGAAEFARKVCGAIPGQGEGLQGSAYGIPTKGRKLETLPIPEIAVSVRRFLDFARDHQNLAFKVSAIGCGLAGYRPEHIAPMFAAAPENCRLPEEFIEALKPWRKLGRFPIRLLVAGSRSITDRDLVHEKLDRLTCKFDSSRVALLSGGAQGVDDIAEGWARARGIAVFRFEPLWRDVSVPHAVVRHGSVGKRYNVRAGMNRNAWMLASASHAVFFGSGQSSEMKDEIQLAARMGIPMRKISIKQTTLSRRLPVLAG